MIITILENHNPLVGGSNPSRATICFSTQSSHTPISSNISRSMWNLIFLPISFIKLQMRWSCSSITVPHLRQTGNCFPWSFSSLWQATNAPRGRGKYYCLFQMKMFAWIEACKYSSRFSYKYRH